MVASSFLHTFHFDMPKKKKKAGGRGRDTERAGIKE
jgi:hypothetical protein